MEVLQSLEHHGQDSQAQEAVPPRGSQVPATKPRGARAEERRGVGSDRAVQPAPAHTCPQAPQGTWRQAACWPPCGADMEEHFLLSWGAPGAPLARLQQ